MGYGRLQTEPKAECRQMENSRFQISSRKQCARAGCGKGGRDRTALEPCGFVQYLFAAPQGVAVVRKKTLENVGRAPQGAPSGPHRSDRSFTKETDGKVSRRMSYEEEARRKVNKMGKKKTLKMLIKQHILKLRKC